MAANVSWRVMMLRFCELALLGASPAPCCPLHPAPCPLPPAPCILHLAPISVLFSFLLFVLLYFYKYIYIYIFVEYTCRVCMLSP